MLSIYKREFGENTENVDCSTSSPPDTPGTASGKPCIFFQCKFWIGNCKHWAQLQQKDTGYCKLKSSWKNKHFKEFHNFFFLLACPPLTKKWFLFSPPWYYFLLFVLFPKHCMVASGEGLGMNEDRFKWGEHGTGMIWLSREPSHAHKNAQKVCGHLQAGESCSSWGGHMYNTGVLKS